MYHLTKIKKQNKVVFLGFVLILYYLDRGLETRGQWQCLSFTIHILKLLAYLFMFALFCDVMAQYCSISIKGLVLSVYGDFFVVHDKKISILYKQIITNQVL